MLAHAVEKRVGSFFWVPRAACPFARADEPLVAPYFNLTRSRGSCPCPEANAGRPAELPGSAALHGWVKPLLKVTPRIRILLWARGPFV